MAPPARASKPGATDSSNLARLIASARHALDKGAATSFDSDCFL
jgi:hypothetical protein